MRNERDDRKKREFMKTISEALDHYDGGVQSYCVGPLFTLLKLVENEGSHMTCTGGKCARG